MGKLFRILFVVFAVYIAICLSARPKPYFIEKDPATKGLTKHHIVPANVLQRFYKTALAESKKSPKIEAALKSDIQHIAVSINDKSLDKRTQQELKKLKEGRMDLNNMNGYAYSLYFWMPGNIFMGPSPDCRKNDPGPGFDEGAKNIIKNQGTFNTLSNLYMDMEQYSKTKNIRYFDEANKNLKKLPNFAPYKYNKDQWSWDTNKKCEIKTA